MVGFTRAERANLKKFLQNYIDEEQVFMMAKSITKNSMPVSDFPGALEVIFLHGADTRTVLNKRHITKDIIFRYLHDNKIPIRTGFTKQSLIDEVILFWAQQHEPPDGATHDDQSRLGAGSAENFPINVMARQFTEWFFTRYNSSQLAVVDFWNDAQLQITIYLEDGIDERDASTSQEVVDTLYRVKNEWQLHYNACILHQGCQGRIDIHGLVLVLACGTIHTPDLCVGVFETVFNLARDPFAENNWKVKSSKFILRSKMNAPGGIELEESESLRQLLALPAPDGDF